MIVFLLVSPSPCPLVLLLPRQAFDAVERQGEWCLRLAAVLHEVCVFGRVVVEIVQHAGRLETAGAEEHLRGKVRFAYFERDTRAALA